MHTFKLTLCYKGTDYLGWQRTQEGPSICATVENALSLLLKTPILLEGASRTDAGVHAHGQVAHFHTLEPLPFSLKTLLKALNGNLPFSIRILDLVEEHPTFHATLLACKKKYTYLICNTPYQLPFYRELSWHLPHPLHYHLIDEAIAHLVGTHDFSAWCNERALWTKSPICTLETIQYEPLQEGRLAFHIVGDHFLYKMVRNLIGTLTSVGLQKLPPSQIPHLLKLQDRRHLPMTAPAHGLYLTHVYYVY